MSKLLSYLLINYLKTVFKVILISYTFGIILNLFEEIEFFKNLDQNILMPLILTALYIPSEIIKMLPFIIFVSSMWFLFNLRNNKDLLDLKVYGYSNFRIFFVLALTSFIFGWIILFAVNPITSSMMKYYEMTKADYSRDIDHLVTINRNGLWIKENLSDGNRIITADETKGIILKNLTIFNLNEKYNLREKIYADTADTTENRWILKSVTLYEFQDGIIKQKFLDEYVIDSSYNHRKITSLYKNFDTMSFLDLLLSYKDLQEMGYIKSYLDQNLNSMMSIPFFLFIMTALASILTMNTLKKSNNFTFIIVGLIASVAIYYFKDLSLALGQTNRISLSLSVWVPVITLGLFSFIGVLQINEK